MKGFFVLLLATHLTSHTAFGLDNLLVNGGFETPLPATQPERFYSGRDLGGWLVGGAVDQYVYLNWDPGNTAEGNQFLYMAANSGGHISQVVNLVVGHEYTLSFKVFSDSTDFNNLPQYEVKVLSDYPADTLQNSRVIADQFFTAKWNPQTSPAPLRQFTAYSINFTALAAQERLSVHAPGYFFLIDAMSLVEVPEPTSIAFLGGVVVVLRRRLRRRRCSSGSDSMWT